MKRYGFILTYENSFNSLTENDFKPEKLNRFMEEEIEAIFDRGVLIPLKKLNIPERSKITLRIEKAEKIDNLRFYSYTKLLREGEDAENLFEF